MPSRKVQCGEEVFVRGTALQVASDALQIRIDDGVLFGLTVWVPARECAKREDIGELKPVRRASRYHIDR